MKAESALDPDRVKTKSDLVVMLSEGRIFAFFCPERDHKPQNSGCGYTAQSFHTAWTHIRHRMCIAAGRKVEIPGHATRGVARFGETTCPISYSITSSARPSSVSGIVRLSALAVFMLMVSCILVTCCTGRSAGF
jgi:hypothetical protein